ncbi:MAG: monovalent cation/H+ antiporter subunit D family protein [Alphaproteobacteria bacterium]|jgi:multicomponent Na+:H+ antiporter subunit D|nr:monovalent cation/H+ antiporter subunit D family protein [Alphaproteobacteria bacterium]
MTASCILAIAPFIPLVGAVLIGLAGRWPNLRETVTMVTAGLLFVAVASLAPGVLAGERPAVTLFELLPGLSIAFELEPLGMLFALIASFLWIPNSLYSIGYMRAHHERHQTRFYICFAIALASAVGIAFSGNLLTLFLFYEALTLSTFPLVTHAGTERAKRAGRVYLGVLLGTSIGFQLLAILATYMLADTLDFRAGGILAGKAPDVVIGALFALYVFGIGKAALMPFHRWLPAAMVAPTPVSALLHAVAVVKGGVFTVMKVVVYVFGLDLVKDADAATWLTWAAAFTILAGSVVALTKDNLKARLAYSTVSQLSYIVLGAMMASSASVVGGSMHILTHAFGKITLFFCAGAILITAHKENISDMRGIGRAMPVTMAAFLVGSLSVIGLPPFAGAWSKWYLALGAMEAGQVLMVAILVVSSLLNVAYFMPIVVRAFFPGPGATDFDNGYREAPLACLVPILVTAAGCLVLFVFPDPAYTLLRQLVEP